MSADIEWLEAVNRALLENQERLALEVKELREQLTIERNDLARLGKRNREAMRILGVPFGHPTEGVVEGAQRVVTALQIIAHYDPQDVPAGTDAAEGLAAIARLALEAK